MAENSAIEWTTHTFNPWRGCTKVSAGCANCYAETLSGRNPKTLGIWGPNGTRVVAAESMWREPAKWNTAAACVCNGLAGKSHMEAFTYCPQHKGSSSRPRVFCASLADVFEDWQGPMTASNGTILGKDFRASSGPRDRLTMQDVRDRLFKVIDATPNLDWLILTKRPENVLRMTYDLWTKKVPGHIQQNEGDGRHWHWPANIWLGTSVENQAAADARIPHLLGAPAAVRFLSCEPLLGEVRLRDVMGLNKLPAVHMSEGRGPAGIDWVIVGGESGGGARPCNLSWIHSLVEQCKSASVPVFVKQLGAVSVLDYTVPSVRGQRSFSVPIVAEDGRVTLRLSDKKGGDIEEFPIDLRVREYPVRS